MEIVRGETPVQEHGPETIESIEPGVVRGEAQGRGVAIAENDVEALRQGGNAGQTQPAADL